MLKDIEEKDLPGRTRYRKPSWDIEQFLRMDENVVEVTDIGRYANVKSAQVSYCSSISRMHAAVSVIRRGDRLFLLKNLG